MVVCNIVICRLVELGYWVVCSQHTFVIQEHLFDRSCFTISVNSFYLPPGSPEGDYNLHHVHVYVRA